MLWDWKNIILLGFKYSQCSSLKSAEKTSFVMSIVSFGNFHALVKMGSVEIKLW